MAHSSTLGTKMSQPLSAYGLTNVAAPDILPSDSISHRNCVQNADCVQEGHAQRRLEFRPRGTAVPTTIVVQPLKLKPIFVPASPSEGVNCGIGRFRMHILIIYLNSKLWLRSEKRKKEIKTGTARHVVPFLQSRFMPLLLHKRNFWYGIIYGIFQCSRTGAIEFFGSQNEVSFQRVLTTAHRSQKLLYIFYLSDRALPQNCRYAFLYWKVKRPIALCSVLGTNEN